MATVAPYHTDSPKPHPSIARSTMTTTIALRARRSRCGTRNLALTENHVARYVSVWASSNACDGVHSPAGSGKGCRRGRGPVSFGPTWGWRSARAVKRDAAGGRVGLG